MSAAGARVRSSRPMRAPRRFAPHGRRGGRMSQFFTIGDPHRHGRVAGSSSLRRSSSPRSARRSASGAESSISASTGSCCWARSARYYAALADASSLLLRDRSSAWASARCLGLVTALVSVTLKAEQGISGIGVYLFALGFSDLLFLKLVGTPSADQPAQGHLDPAPRPHSDRRRDALQTGHPRVRRVPARARRRLPPQPDDVWPEHQGGRRESRRGRQPRRQHARASATRP